MKAVSKRREKWKDTVENEGKRKNKDEGEGEVAKAPNLTLTSLRSPKEKAASLTFLAFPSSKNKE